MKKTLILLLLISSFAQAQYSIKGTIAPLHKDDWVILYRIEGPKQIFIKNTTIKTDTINIGKEKKPVGVFDFQLPEDAKKGTYRVTYSLESSGYVDFLFNKENISFVFNPHYPRQSIAFLASKENQLYKEYLEVMTVAQHKLDSIQILAISLKNPNDSLRYSYKKTLKNITNIQKKYIGDSQDMLVNHFIKAIYRKNTPEIIFSRQEYVNHFLDNFFTNIDFSDEILYNSSFLSNKITNYIFDLNYTEENSFQQKIYKESIDEVINKISNLEFREGILEFLIRQFEATENTETIDYIFKNHYNKLPEAIQNKKFKSKILEKLLVAIGRVAPDFSWKKGTQLYKLSTLKGASHYILTFWSTSCSHCLREIPQLYTYTKDKPTVKVVSFGLEKDRYDWDNYIHTLDGWHTVLGLGKWENKIARKYQIFSTPTYFILDSDKKIIAKPTTIEEVKQFLEKRN